MKTSLDPRHRKRIKLVQQLFAATFAHGRSEEEIPEIATHLPKIDAQIQAAAPEWPLEKVSKIDLSILRLAAYELTIVKKEPPKVIIDEAVEIAKEFGSDTSPKFINGALGTILKNLWH